MPDFPAGSQPTQPLPCGCEVRMTPDWKYIGITPCGRAHAELAWYWLPEHIAGVWVSEPESDPNQIDILGNTGALE